MYLAYSAIRTNNQGNQHEKTENERLLRYLAYQTTCNKYRHEIAAIQKFLPGWVPEFK